MFVYHLFGQTIVTGMNPLAFAGAIVMVGIVGLSPLVLLLAAPIVAYIDSRSRRARRTRYVRRSRRYHSH
jgi:hypothetical protein